MRIETFIHIGILPNPRALKYAEETAIVLQRPRLCKHTDLITQLKFSWGNKEFVA